MTAKETRAYQNIQAWRRLSQADRIAIGHKVVVSQVKNSMAMEGEPVSSLWLKQNAR